MADESSPVAESSQPTKDEKSDSQGNSTEKETSQPKVSRSIPHYLRASSGSCHDACKYGKTHEFVKKPRPLIRRRRNAEIPVEIYTPETKRSVKEAKAGKANAAASSGISPPSPSPSPSPSSSPSHDVLMLAKQKCIRPIRSPPSVTSKSVRQGVTSQMKASSPSTSKSVRQGVTSQMKAHTPSASKSAKKELHLNSSSSGSSGSNKQALSSDVISSPPPIKLGASSSLRSPVTKASNMIKKAARSSSPATKPLASASLRTPATKASNIIKQNVSTPSRRKSISAGTSDLIKPYVSTPSHRKSISAGPSDFIKPNVSTPSHRKSISAGPSDFIKPNVGKTMRCSSVESSASTGGSLRSVSRSVGSKQLPSTNLMGQTSRKGVNAARNGGSKTGSPSFPKAATKKSLAPTTSHLSPITKNISQSPVKRTSASSISGTKSASMSVRKKGTQSDGSQGSEGSCRDLISTGHSDAKELADERTAEKTLHVIKVETDCQTTISAEDGAQIMQSQLVLSPGSLNSISHSNSPSFSSNGAVEPNADSEYTYGSESDGSFSEYEDDVEGDGNDIIEGEHHEKTRHSRMLSSEDNQSAPTKLKFRRGKVVDPEARGDAPPRRLRFRRRRALTVDQGANAGSHRRIKVKVVDTDHAADLDTAGEKVVLRHQDTQAKKNDQGLFNNVIEETASKLAETRKSKVKALVGAFETVISLQEGKPSGDKSPHSSPGR